MMRVVGGVRKSIQQSWLAKGFGLWLLCWGFKGVKEEIPLEKASTLQIWPVAFPLRQCTSPQLHSGHRLFDQDGQQLLSLPLVKTLFPVTFGYSLSSEAVVMRQLRRWMMLWRRGLPRGIAEVFGTVKKCIAAGRDYFEGDQSFMCVLSIKCPCEKSLETYLMNLVYLFYSSN